ncbi:MAG TPA: methyltransferase domain-containing protein [Candidatus Sulfotelmatobacter sp.]|nr:methyltransferase domain-containing protein [Candidatus Sulfotelmatobacter sp.]
MNGGVHTVSPGHAVSVAEGYARWAPTYDRSANPLLAREERHLWPLFAGVGKKRLLDVACGTGRWLEKLTSQVQSAAGVDLSRAMLQVAKTKSGVAGKLVEASGEHLPFRTQCFDLLICSFALGHIHALGALVDELSRVARSGANLFVTDLHPEAHAQGWRVGFRDAWETLHIEVFPRSSDEYIQAFSRARFECVRHLPLWLGEPEMPIFARANKAAFFESACRVPAVLCFHFRKSGSPTGMRDS